MFSNGISPAKKEINSTGTNKAWNKRQSKGCGSGHSLDSRVFLMDLYMATKPEILLAQLYVLM